MICEKYENLTHQEKIKFIGKLHHAVQSDNYLFDLANKLIKLAEEKGIFDAVTIAPQMAETN